MIKQDEIRRNYESIAPEERDEDHQQVLRASVQTATTSDLQSIIAVYVVTVVADMSRGLLFPVLWLRVQYIGGMASAQGFVVAGFSVGRLIGNLD